MEDYTAYFGFVFRDFYTWLAENFPDVSPSKHTADRLAAYRLFQWEVRRGQDSHETVA